MSRLRREVADDAIVLRRLPSEELRERYLRAVIDFEACHEAWMRSRAAVLAAAQEGSEPDQSSGLDS